MQAGFSSIFGVFFKLDLFFFFVMSKRTATAPLVASKMPTRTGLVYLVHQLKSLQDTDYVITTNESDFFRWEVGLPASVLQTSCKRTCRGGRRKRESLP